MNPDYNTAEKILADLKSQWDAKELELCALERSHNTCTAEDYHINVMEMNSLVTQMDLLDELIGLYEGKEKTTNE